MTIVERLFVAAVFVAAFLGAVAVSGHYVSEYAYIQAGYKKAVVPVKLGAVWVSPAPSEEKLNIPARGQ